MNLTGLPKHQRKAAHFASLLSRSLALGILAFTLAACGNPAATPTPIQAAELTATTSALVSTATVEPTPTLVPTEVPDPEVTFEQLALMDESIGKFTQDQEGNLLFHAALYNPEVGQNIPVVQQYRELGLDGGPEIWVAPNKYPYAPIVIQDLDTGEIRQGPFSYDNDVRRRLTLPRPDRPFGAALEGMDGQLVDLNFVETARVLVWDYYGISMFPNGEIVEQYGHLVLPVKSYVGDAEDLLVFEYYLPLGPTDEANGHWDPYYTTDTGGQRFGYTFKDILNYFDSFSSRFRIGVQFAVSGSYTTPDRLNIPNTLYASNDYYLLENPGSEAIISTLETAGLPEDLSSLNEGQNLYLFGAKFFFFP